MCIYEPQNARIYLRNSLLLFGDVIIIVRNLVLIFVGWGSASSMAARYDCSDSAPFSLPSPFPKSPPEYPDLYGKRREMTKIQVLEREIGYLEAELKSEDGLQPASRSCKEIVDFVAANSDPLIPTLKKNLRRYHRFRKWLGGLPRFDLSRIYRCCHCCNFNCNWIPLCPADCFRWRPTTPNCLSCALPNCLQCRPTSPDCLSCAVREPLQWQPNWFCCSCPDLRRCKNTSFGRLCHSSLPDGSFTKCKCLCYCPECPSIHPSCCLPSYCRRSCCDCSCCFNPRHMCC